MTKNNKAPGPDDLCSEILELIDENNLKILEVVFNNLYPTGIYPEGWLKSTFTTLPKKTNDM